MASSNMRALWEARADQELANMALKPNPALNQRKHSNIEQPNDQHRPRLGSNRRALSGKKKKGEKLNGMGRTSTESVESLDEILLSLQNAIVADEEDGTNMNGQENPMKEGPDSAINENASKSEEKSPEIIRNRLVHRKLSDNKESNQIEETEKVSIHNSNKFEGNTSAITKNELVLRQISANKDSKLTENNGQFLRQNSNNLVPKSPITTIIKPFNRQNSDKKSEANNGIHGPTQTQQSVDAKVTNDAGNVADGGANFLAHALKSLKSTESFEKNEQEDEHEKIDDKITPLSPCQQTDILMRKVDETTADICLTRRNSARLSLHNTLEMVPEDEPFETKHNEQKENRNNDEFIDITEELEKCNDFESLKSACISSFVALNKKIDEIKTSMQKEEGENKQILTTTPAILSPPPPPPPGPPPLALAPRKIVITKAPKPSMASTAVAAVGTVNLMDEIKRKQMIRKGRKSLKSKYEDLDNK